MNALSFIQANLTEIGLAVAILSLIVSAIGTFRSDIDADLLADQDSLGELAEELRGGIAETYIRAVQSTLDFATRLWGDKLLGQDAFVRSLQISIVYPTVATMLCWLVFNVHTVGGVTTFADGLDLGGRVLTLVPVLLGSASLAYGVRLGITGNDTWKNRPDHFLTKLFGEDRVDEQLSTIFMFGPMVILVIMHHFVPAFFAPSWPSIFVGVAVMFSPLWVATAMVGGAVLLAVGGAIAYAVGYSYVTDSFTSSILLLLVLPVTNALADFFSVGATRYFLQRAVTKGAALGAILFHLVLDIGVGLICLTLLIAANVAALTFWSNVFPNTLFFNWDIYLNQIAREPTAGVALFLMVLTTLLPTMVHIVAGLGAVIAQGSRLSRRQARVIEEWQATGATPSLKQRRQVAKRINRARFFGYALATILFFAVPLGLYTLVAPLVA